MSTDITGKWGASTWGSGSSISKWCGTVSLGGTCATTSRASSPRRRPMPASIAAACGLSRIRVPPWEWRREKRAAARSGR
jgi:hypothetical protein